MLKQVINCKLKTAESHWLVVKSLHTCVLLVSLVCVIVRVHFATTTERHVPRTDATAD